MLFFASGPRYNYWSESRLARFLLKGSKPRSATAEEWDEWTMNIKIKHPIRYWIADTGLIFAQDVCMLPLDIYHIIHTYINNRYISKIHALTATSKHLKRGQYYDIDTRMFYCLFDTLVKYVESEVAHMSVWSNGSDESKNKKYKFKHGRCKEAGIDYLNWEKSLLLDKEMGTAIDSPFYNTPTDQAFKAMKVLELYTWYTEVYENRKSSYVLSGLEEYDKNHPRTADLLSGMGNTNKDKSNLLNKMRDIDTQYEKEEDNKLLELIKLRRSLWT
jgi:hypothetical protein